MEEQIIILAKLNQLKDMQIFLLKEEEKLKAELARLKNQRVKEMKLLVSKKNVYGVERVYPICNKAKLFAAISGNKTLLPEIIELVKKLGYNLTTESEKI